MPGFILTRRVGIKEETDIFSNHSLHRKECLHPCFRAHSQGSYFLLVALMEDGSQQSAELFDVALFKNPPTVAYKFGASPRI